MGEFRAWDRLLSRGKSMRVWGVGGCEGVGEGGCCCEGVSVDVSEGE